MNGPFIEQRLAELVSPNDLLTEAMRYALLGPGKRIRPLLVLAAAATFGATPASALDPACAIEMIHAYSLIHDDLPCMDDDDFRRGRPSLHRAFPEAIALLAGDGLLTEAFGVISRAKHLDDSVKVRLMAALANRSGCSGMAGGQAIDILSENKNISADLLLEMHQKKTGDLLSCCLEFGAIIAKASPEQEALMRRIGLHLGLAYQIRDDLEDASESDEGKPTSVSIFGRSGAEKMLSQSIDAIEAGLSQLPEKEPIATLLSPLFHDFTCKK